MTQWLVPYRATYQGTAVVEADTAGEAERIVDSGVFDVDPSAEMVDWESSGSARAAE